MKEEDTKELIAVMSDSSAKEAAAILHNAGYNRYNGLVDQVKDAIRDNKKWESRTLAANRALGVMAWGDQVKEIENLIAKNASLKTHIEKMDAAHREEIEKLEELLREVVTPRVEIHSSDERIAELEADLAESPRIEIALREAHIDALETQNAELQKRIEELEAELAGCEVRIEELEEEVEKWKSKADLEGEALWRAEYVRDEYAELLADARGANIRAYEMGKREASEQQRLRNIVRRAMRVVMEVVR